MKRKERMCWYIERICSILQHLPYTQANETECMALLANLYLSHTDIVEMLEHICPITIRKAKWKGKWHMRWLELAEKFKEAK